VPGAEQPAGGVTPGRVPDHGHVVGVDAVPQRVARRAVERLHPGEHVAGVGGLVGHVRPVDLEELARVRERRRGHHEAGGGPGGQRAGVTLGRSAQPVTEQHQRKPPGRRRTDGPPELLPGRRLPPLHPLGPRPTAGEPAGRAPGALIEPGRLVPGRRIEDQRGQRPVVSALEIEDAQTDRIGDVLHRRRCDRGRRRRRRPSRHGGVDATARGEGDNERYRRAAHPLSCRHDPTLRLNPPTKG
jgi:hypothetical protein